MITLTLKWLGLVCTLLGAISTSLAMDPLNIILLNMGSFFYLCWAIRVKDLNLILVNGGLLTIYLLGFILRM
jgi:hypothetical protein